MKKELKMKTKTKTKKDFINVCAKANKYLKSNFSDYETSEFVLYLDILKTNALFDNITRVDEKIDDFDKELDMQLSRLFQEIKERFEEVDEEIKKLKKEVKNENKTRRFEKE